MKALTERRDHVARASVPWRTQTLTECGRQVGEVASTISVADLHHRIATHGQQRTAFTVCMTCWNASNAAAQWDVNPVGVIAREAQRAGVGYRQASTRTEAVQLTAELRAIEALVAAHRSEFDAYLQGLGETASLDDFRRRKTQQRTVR